MKGLLFMAVFTIGVLPTAALDNTLKDSFWDTSGYANPAPSVARSAGSATAVDLSGRSWRVAERLPKEFRSKKFVAFSFVVR